MRFSVSFLLTLFLCLAIISCENKSNPQGNEPSVKEEIPIDTIVEVAITEIEATQTSTAVFIGYSETAMHEGQNCTNKAVRINSWADYVQIYGNSSARYYLWESVNLFFQNGGKECYIISVSNTETSLQKGTLLRGLEISREVDAQLVLIPDAVGLSPNDFYEVQNSMISLCGELKDRMAILNTFDPTSNYETDFNNFRNLTESENLSYAAVYYPWLITSDGTHVPPAGAMAGVYAATDETRGVWTSPANRSINGIANLTQNLDDRASEVANVDAVAGKSINLIRTFPGRGILAWGARTLDGNSNDWRYISVRRTMLLVERSMDEGLAWVPTQANDVELWAEVKEKISAFLANLQRNGALQGATVDEAYAVRCGLGETMTAEDIRNGVLRYTVTLAVVRPAEFIVINKEIQMAE